MRKIDKIILHCTATPEGREVWPDEIKKWHLNRGFHDIGYHYIVMLDGSVCNGRPVSILGAHCKGQNSHSIGVAYVGGTDHKGNAKDTRTSEQKEALRKLVKNLQDVYPNATIHGHYEFSNKACPSFNIKDL